jgi:16S rRNA (cytidine1402-2'-O)-methyltransferase
MEINYDKIFNNLSKQTITNGLYIVSLPIGNMSDITIRALYVLSLSKKILCEDTRMTAKILEFYNLPKIPLIKFTDHDNNFEELSSFCNDNIISIVSDAGTPLISDPGMKLVQKLVIDKVNIFSVPGACSIVAGLTVSGCVYESFYFHGFFDKDKFAAFAQNTSFHDSFCEGKSVFVMFDNAKSLVKSIDYIRQKTCCKFNITISRELTKINEETIRFTSDDEVPVMKGELVIILSNFASSEHVATISEEDLAANLTSKYPSLLKLTNREIVEMVESIKASGSKFSRKKFYNALNRSTT